MELASIIERYRERFQYHYGAATTPEQWSALNAIQGCRRGQYGEMNLTCPSCHRHQRCYLSCGHRACNRCLNHCTTQWLQRQTQKLLPVNYYMITFTLPKALRPLAMRNSRRMYDALMQCAASTVRSFGRNHPDLKADLGITAVLHTHSRQLDYHPHVHLVVTGGGVTPDRKQWRTLPGKYLFNGHALAKVFRARLLQALHRSAIKLPSVPRQWVAQCQRVGRGLSALKYLSRYLYRGVISDKQIIKDDGTHVTFQYRQGGSNLHRRRQLKGEAFIALIALHTLPKGFRRVRSYGFCHGNAKRLLRTVQWVLKVVLPLMPANERPRINCPTCQMPMAITSIVRPRRGSG